MTKAKKILSVLLAMSILMSSIFVSGIFVSAAADLYTTTMTFDDDFANNDVQFSGYASGPGGYSCAVFSVDGTVPQTNNGDQDHYLGCWGVNVADVTAIGGTGNALHWDTGLPYDYKWLPRSTVYTHNVVNGNLERFKPKGNTTYEIRLKYYAAKDPAHDMVMTVRWSEYDEVHFGYEFNENHVWCDNVFTVTDATNGWVEAVAKFTTPASPGYMNLVMSTVNSSNASGVEIYTDDITVSECTTITAHNFDESGDKSLYASQYNTIADLEVPTREGYIFSGIYSDAALTNKVNTSEKAINYTDLYYAWNELEEGEYYCGFEDYTTDTNGVSYDSSVSGIVGGDTYAGGYAMNNVLANGNLVSFELRDKTPFTVVKDTEYSISFAYKATDDAKVYAGLAAASSVPSSAYALSGANLEATNSWKTATIDVTLDRGTTDGMVLALMLSADDATVMIDDVFITYPFDSSTVNMPSIDDPGSDWYPTLGVFEGITFGESSAIWDGKTLKAPVDTNDDGVYEINSAEELAYTVLNGGEGKNYIILKDIYLNDVTKVNWLTGEIAEGQSINSWFTVYASGYKAFSGTIDGNYHTIYGLYFNTDNTNYTLYNDGCALIPRAATASTTTIKNLAIDKAYVHYQSSAAAFVASGLEDSVVNIENSYVGKDVCLKGGAAAAFRAYGIRANGVSLKNCYSLATTIAMPHYESGEAGCYGLVGFLWEEDGTKATFNNCYNANGPLSFGTDSNYYCVAKNSYATEVSQKSEGVGVLTSGVTILTADNMQGSNALETGEKMVGLNAFGNNYVATDTYPTLSGFKGIAVNEVWDGSTSEPTETDAQGNVLIHNGQELAWIISNGGVAGTTYKLTNNIYLNRLDIINWKTGATPEGYTPTPWYTSKTFKGNLNGDGYTVYGLYSNAGVDTSSMSNGFGNAAGLIPNIPNGSNTVIEKVGVDYMFINAPSTASPLVGSVGSNVSTDPGTTLTIDQCYVGENVDVTAAAAGHVRGFARWCTLTVTNTYSLATVRSKDESTAFDPELSFFIANGWDSKFATLKNCYNAIGGYYKGGWPSIATRVNNYAGGLTPGQSTVWYVCNGDKSLDRETMTGLDALTASNKMPKLNVDENGNTTTMYTATEGYPILTVFDGKMDSTIKAPVVDEEVDEEDNNTGSSDNTTYTIWDGTTSTAPTKGTGTESDPIIINEAAELHYVIKNGGAADTYYKLNKDIYLNDLTKVNWLTGTIAEGYKVKGWLKGVDAVFQGNIDGNGHTVYGLYVQDEKLSYSNYHSYGAGLVPHASTGTTTIKNLAIDSSFMRYEAGCGLFIGAVGQADVSLSNCYAGANVGLDGGSVSGLVGVVYNGSAKLLNCYSLASVIHSEIDGLVAANYNGTARSIVINNCFNANGPVADYNYSTTTVNNCFQTKSGKHVSGTTTISQDMMKGEDVLTNPAKMAGLTMANAYITKTATFAQQDIYTYLPAGTTIDSTLKVKFFDNMMAPLAKKAVLLRGKMLRGAYVKFEELPDETLVNIPLSKATKANIRGGAIEILANSEYYGIESEIISEHLDKQSENSVNYLFVTDIHNTHTAETALKSARGTANMKQMELLAKLANENDEIDFIALGGDLGQGYSENKQNHLDYLTALLTPLLESKKPVLALTGNHDDNSYHDNGAMNCVISNKDWNDTVIKYLEDGIGFTVVHDKDEVNSKYYYYDIPAKKTRVICLNASDYPQKYDPVTGDLTWLADNNTTVSETNRGRYKTGYNFWGYSDAQVEWVANDALNAEDGWNYIVLSHMAIDKSTSGGETYKNGDVLRDIFRDFQSKNYYLNEGLGIDRNWTETNGKILSYQFGHEHKNSVKYNEDIDLWQFATTSSGGSNSSLSQIFYSENQLDFDLMTVNENYIYRHAVGGGTDGEFISSYYQLEGDINVDGEVDILDAVKFALIKEGKVLPTARTNYQNETKIRRIILGDIIALPDYYQDEAAQDAAKINAVLASSSENTATFLHWTDVHWRTNHESSYKLLKYFTQTTPIDKVNFTGDVGNDNDPTPDGINEWRKVSLMLPNHHSVTGNHEYTTPHLYEYAIESDGPKDEWDTAADADGDGEKETFIDGQRTKQNIYNYLLAPEFAQNPDVIKGNKEGELCYYIDNEAEKTRYMYLKNSRGFGSGPSLYEYQWMVETLESTPAGWHIVAFSHEWFQSTTSHPDPANVYETPENSRGVQKLFDDYNARSIGYTNYYSVPFDFSGNTATVELMVAGDNHRDNVSFTKGGIPMVILMTDGQGRSKNNKPDVQANDGTADENAVSTFIVDYDNRVVNIIRTGANGDIIVPLTAVGATYVEPTYCTDLLVDEDDVIEGLYIEKTSETEGTAFSSTKFIELAEMGETWKYRDDITFRFDGLEATPADFNIILYTGNATDGYVADTYIDLDWSYACTRPGTSTGYTYPVVYELDENGYITYVDITSQTSRKNGDAPLFTAVRFCAKGLSTDTVMTYNEFIVK